jgi:membrane protease YdiL (CAAX protease family)
VREIGKILAYAAAVVLLGCLFAPPLYWAGRWAESFIPALEGIRFSRYFNRAVLIVALLLLWPFLRWIGVRRWTELELEPNPRRFRDLGVGAALAVSGLWAVAGAAAALGAFRVKSPSAADLLLALATGVAVALIEETFFRGALFGVLRKSLSWPRALAFLSVFFAILHFIKPHRAARKLEDISWLSGFEILPYAFYRFREPELVLLGLVTLVIFGWILGYAVVRTRSLYLAMGLHGGWVFALKSFDSMSRRVGKGSLWLGSDLTIGVIPVVLLLGSLGVLWYVLRDRRTT